MIYENSLNVFYYGFCSTVLSFYTSVCPIYFDSWNFYAGSLVCELSKLRR